VGFRMTPDDLALFAQKLDDEAVLLLPYRHAGSAPDLLGTLADRREGIVWLVRSAEDLAQVRMDHVPQQGYWTVDQILSPVVEVSPGGISGLDVVPGRLHFNTGYFDDRGNYQDFPPAFVKWADGLVRWIRRNFHRDGSIYNGPGARAMRESRGS